MLLTDFCNQRAIHAPMKRSIPERGAFAATDRPRALWLSFTGSHADARPAPLCSSASAHCAASSRSRYSCGCRSRTAPGRCAFDDAHRASGPLAHDLRVFEETRTAPGGAPVPWRFRPHVRLSCGHLCHPLSRRRSAPAETGTPHRRHEPLWSPPRQRRALRRDPG
jgi:hypothetical protein